MIKSMLFLDVVYGGTNISHKITYQPTYTNRINNSGANTSMMEK